MELYKHQQKILDEFPKKHLLAHGTGTGKTITSLALANKANTTTLIICPKSIKEQWIERAPNEYAVLTKEEFKRKAMDLPQYNCIIVDEAHNFSGMKSQMSKILIWYIKKHAPTYIYLLTATPYMSTPWSIYRLAQILGHEWGYMTFKTRFFQTVYMGRLAVPVVKKGIESQIAKLVASLGSTVALEDCVDVPDQIFEVEYFGLTKEQKLAIADIKTQETNHIVKWTRIHQVCGGTLKGDGYTEDRMFDSEKRTRLHEYIEQNNKIVVVCRYLNEVYSLAKDIGNKFKKDVFTISGREKNRHQIIKDANNSQNCVVIAQAAASEGYELATFPLMIFYSYDFSLKNYIQMIGRIQRINALKKNVYISLVVRDSIDNDVYKCILKKEDFHLALYSKQ